MFGLEKLNSLSLSYIKLNDETISGLGRHLQESTTLKNLKLHNMIVEHQGYVNLIESLALSTCLETVLIHQFDAQSIYLSALYKLIAESESLMSLEAFFEPGRDESRFGNQDDLFAAINKSKSLVNLVIDFAHKTRFKIYDLMKHLSTCRINTIRFYSVLPIVKNEESEADLWAFDAPEFYTELQTESMLENFLLSSKERRRLPIMTQNTGQASAKIHALRHMESHQIVKNARMIMSMRPKQDAKLVLPTELLILVLIRSGLTESLWPNEWFATITRCLLDRRTLGKVRHDSIAFSQTALQSVCRKAVRNLD